MSRGFSPPRSTPHTVRPLAVYVASLPCFEVCAPSWLSALKVKVQLFLDLPLVDHGWSEMNSVLQRLDCKDCGQHWMLSRGPGK